MSTGIAEPTTAVTVPITSLPGRHPALKPVSRSMAPMKPVAKHPVMLFDGIAGGG